MATTEPMTEPASLAERYRVLLEIGHALTGTLGDDELYAAIYRETSRVIEADGFYVSLYDAAVDRATVVFWAEGGESRRAQIGYPGSESQVIRTGTPAMVMDRLQDNSLLVLGDGGPQVTRSAISAPMRAGGKVLGVISAQSYRPEAYSRSDLELLTGIADLAAVATQNVIHVSMLEHRRREAENMEEIVRALVGSLDVEEVLSRVAEAALDLLEGGEAVVFLFGEESAKVAASRGPLAPPAGTEIPLEGEWVRLLVEDRRTLVLEGLDRNPLLSERAREVLGEVRSGLVAPLSVGDRVTGALFVCVAEERAFREEEAHLLQRLAGHAAVALQNARLHTRLQTLSLTDPLTKLPNRRHLELHLAREFAAAQRGRRISMVLFDLDNFKQYNDAFGHLAGDGVLEAMGEVLAGETRAMNLVARYGGDEFVAVLSDTSYDGARLHVSRVADKVARHPALGPHGISVTAGVAEYVEGMETVRDLIRAVDEDMYRTKASRGRG